MRSKVFVRLKVALLVDALEGGIFAPRLKAREDSVNKDVYEELLEFLQIMTQKMERITA